MTTPLSITTQNMRFLSHSVLPMHSPVSQENKGVHQLVPINVTIAKFPVDFICLGVVSLYKYMYGIELHVGSITGCHHMYT